ncbi:Arc family DNA-binding protein [Moraxella osloensis]|uniref:Arc family DNA-binding protein n=1 Tax=Faucicola osloensis TaxID=34062 RepID=A0A2I1RIY2_FAUOS|nr:Arc family DNA-binding protein [Moraxella osloensis]PKZ69083.1 Arc family DNA-binding protein [Moraxella osloensis]
MARKEPQLNFRMNAEIVEWLKAYAKQNRRSITAQLTIILEQEKQRVTAN